MRGPFTIGDHKTQIWSADHELVCNVAQGMDGDKVLEALNEQWGKTKHQHQIVMTEDCIDRTWTYYDDPRDGKEMTMLARSVIRSTPGITGTKKKVVAMKWYLNFLHPHAAIRESCANASKAIKEQMEEDGVNVTEFKLEDFDIRTEKENAL